MSSSEVLVERKACFHVANVFLSRLELISLTSMLKMSKMPKKNVFLPKTARFQWVKVAKELGDAGTS